MGGGRRCSRPAGGGALRLLFVPPYGTFAVSDVRYLLTFGDDARRGAHHRWAHDAGPRAGGGGARCGSGAPSTLYAVSRDLAGARTRPDLARVTLRHLHDSFGGSVTLLLPGADGRLERSPSFPPAAARREDLGVARWVFEHGSPAGLGTDTLPAAGGAVPPAAHAGARPRRRRAATPDRRRSDPAQRQLLDSRARPDRRRARAHGARRGDAARAPRGRVRATPHRPAEFAVARPPDAAGRHRGRGQHACCEDAGRCLRPRGGISPQTIVEEARRMTRLIGNLLDMMRVESGALAVQREWHVAGGDRGGGPAARGGSAGGSPRDDASCRPTLPLVPIDDVLIEQVLINLLENAASTRRPAPRSRSARRRCVRARSW